MFFKATSFSLSKCLILYQMFFLNKEELGDKSLGVGSCGIGGGDGGWELGDGGWEWELK